MYGENFPPEIDIRPMRYFNITFYTGNDDPIANPKDVDLAADQAFKNPAIKKKRNRKIDGGHLVYFTGKDLSYID